MKRRIAYTIWLLALAIGLGYAGALDMQAEIAYYGDTP